VHRWISLVTVGFVLSSAIAGLLYWSCNGDGRESFGDKHEWSILQTLEARGRDTHVSTLEFSEYERYHIVSLPAATGERIWIMLNPHSPPYYKQMPPADYTLTQEQLWQILQRDRAISTVEECLRSHVQRAP
jgi:hypothetical protein